MSSAFAPHNRGGWVDTKRGIFYRRRAGEIESNKRKPPVRLAIRLLGHLRRWESTQDCLVTFNGAPVNDISKAFRQCVKAAGLEGKVTPHTLRHTLATWLMQEGAEKWQVAGYLGMSMEMLERVYGHHHPDHLQGVVATIDKPRGRETVAHSVAQIIPFESMGG